MSGARAMLVRAKEKGCAIGAFNTANLETIKAIVSAAKKFRSPVIIEASDGEVNFVGRRQLVALVRAFESESGIPIILNLDHAPTKESIFEAIDAGFDYVHFDGSKLPFEENIAITKEVVTVAHARGVMVEAEFTAITGSSADHRNESVTTVQDVSNYTSPEQAKQFIEATGVDTLASFVGNAHGLYKDQKRISIDQLQKIRAAIPDTFLSLHGGSGIPAEDIKAAITAGIVKINVNSELRVAFRDALRKAIVKTDDVAAYKFMPPAIDAVQEIVEGKIQLFGSGALYA